MKISALLIALLGSFSFGAYASDFSVVSEQSSIRFTSEAPMETVHGQTQNISGTVSVNPPSLAGAKASFLVEADTLKTGNRLRDRNMKDHFLETEKFSQITFSLRGVPGSLSSGHESVLKATGTFTIHGVTKEKNIPLSVLWDEKGGTLHVKASCPLLLSEFGIERPRILILRLSDTVVVDVDLFLKKSL